MYLLAPALITFGLSFILYREEGKWNPVDLWPKNLYDAYAEIKLRRAAGGIGTEESLARYGVRDYYEESLARLGVRGYLGKDVYSEQALKDYRKSQEAIEKDLTQSGTF